MAELDVAQLAFLGLLRSAHRIAGHATAHVLVAETLRQDGVPVLGATRHGELAQHVVFHERENFAEILVLVVVSVDVDDDHVVEVALHGLLAGMAQELGCVEFLDRYAATAVSNEIHGFSPFEFFRLLVSRDAARANGRSNFATCRARTPRGSRRAEAHS